MQKLNYKSNIDEIGNSLMETLTEIKKEGITHSVFGDIFLEDLRKYREGQLAKINFEQLRNDKYGGRCTRIWMYDNEKLFQFIFKNPSAKKKPKDFSVAPMQGNSLLGRGSP